MNISILGKNVEITEAMKQQAEVKLANIQKYFNDDHEIQVRVLVKIYGEYQKVEITMDSPVGLLRTEVKQRDFYSALDRAIDRLEDQIRRQKTRLSKRQREKLSHAFLEEIDRYEQVIESHPKEEPVRTKSVLAEKMSLTQAIMKMELLGHDFFVYTDDETNEVAVVYVRYDGGYGLLEIEKEN